MVSNHAYLLQGEVNGNQIQVKTVQTISTHANTRQPIQDGVRTIRHKLYRLRCNHMEEVLMNMYTERIVEEFTALNDLYLAHLRDLIETKQYERALKLINERLANR